MAGEFQVTGKNAAALFTLKLHRGDGMALLAMNWKDGKPPEDFVGFAIEYKEPGGDRFFALKNRLSFPDAAAAVNPTTLSTRLSPIQKFRWVHFPRNAELPGEFVYRVTPVFMNEQDELSYGEPQEAAIELRRETYPGSSTSPSRAASCRRRRSWTATQSRRTGSRRCCRRTPTTDWTSCRRIRKAKEALAWMGFEARHAILEVLDQAIADTKAAGPRRRLRPERAGVVSRLEKLGKRLKMIIDDDGAHGKPRSAETQAAERLAVSAGSEQREAPAHGQAAAQQDHRGRRPEGAGGRVRLDQLHLARLLRAVEQRRRPARQERGQAVPRGVRRLLAERRAPQASARRLRADWTSSDLSGIDAQVAFSPHAPQNALLRDDRRRHRQEDDVEPLLLARVSVPDARADPATRSRRSPTDETIFVYGISDKKVGGIDAAEARRQRRRRSIPRRSRRTLPEPFKSEPTGGRRQPHAPQVRRHRLRQADRAGLPRLLQLLLAGRHEERREPAPHPRPPHRGVLHDRGAAHLRPLPLQGRAAGGQEGQEEAPTAKPPRKPGEKPWWTEDHTNARKIRDRELFA